MPDLPETIEKELQRLKAYFPYRNVWAAEKCGEWRTGATLNRRLPNKLSREGWNVGIVTAN